MIKKILDWLVTSFREMYSDEGKIYSVVRVRGIPWYCKCGNSVLIKINDTYRCIECGTNYIGEN